MPLEALAELHEQIMSDEYKAEIALELEGVERGIANMRSSMTTSTGREMFDPEHPVFQNILKKLWFSP